MARYTDSVCKQCRREGMKLFLKGERCFTPKCAIEKRKLNRLAFMAIAVCAARCLTLAASCAKSKKCDASMAFMNVSSVVISARLSRSKGLTGATLLQLLERRLDNVVFRMGFATSRSQARQLVTHGHFTVNGRKVDIASYSVRPGDVVQVSERSRGSALFQGTDRRFGQHTPPKWVTIDPAALSGSDGRFATRDDIDVPINEQLIVEFYSR